MGDGERRTMTRVTSARSRPSFLAFALFPFPNSNPRNWHLPEEDGRSGLCQGTRVRDWGGRCLLDGVSFGRRLLLAVSAEGSAVAAAALGASTYPSLTLAEICCRGVLPSRKHSFPPAQGLGMPSGQRVCLGLRPELDLSHGDLSEHWKIRRYPGAASRCSHIAHPCPAPAHAHLGRSFILNIHPQVSVCSGRWIPSPSGGIPSPSRGRGEGRGEGAPQMFSPHRDVSPNCASSSLLLNRKSGSHYRVWKPLSLTCWLFVPAL